MYKYFLWWTACLLSLSGAVAQSNPDSLLMAQLVADIRQAQVKTKGPDFYPGMLPAYRMCGGSPHNYQPDNNIFFTAIAVLALKNLLPVLAAPAADTCRQMIADALTCYPYFQDRYGHPFYNFWPTRGIILPHTYVFKYLTNVFGQSEDADDSVMALLGADNNDSACRVLKQRMIETSNGWRKRIISTYKKYRSIPAYSTWLGYRMPVDFDFGVHCNILYFMLEKKLPMVRQDSATISLLAQMVANRQYLKAPVYLSPYYVRTPVLLYHLARLMGRFHLPELEPYKPQLIADINRQLEVSHNIMDQIILRTSLLRLGAAAPLLPLHSLTEFNNSNQQQFVFFQARAAFSYPTPLKQIFLHWSYIYYLFYSPAYNKVLWLEYLAEKQKKSR